MMSIIDKIHGMLLLEFFAAFIPVEVIGLFTIECADLVESLTFKFYINCKTYEIVLTFLAF